MHTIKNGLNMKQLSNRLKPMIKGKRHEMENSQQEGVFKGNFLLATQLSFFSSSSICIETYSAMSSIKRQITDYASTLKLFLLNQNYQCAFINWNLPYAMLLGAEHYCETTDSNGGIQLAYELYRQLKERYIYNKHHAHV